MRKACTTDRPFLNTGSILEVVGLVSIRMITDDFSILQTQVFKMVTENLANEKSVREVDVTSVQSVQRSKKPTKSDLPESSSSCE